VGEHDAIGFSPFSIESAEEPVRGSLSDGYDVLTQLAPLILDNQGKGKMVGLLPGGPINERRRSAIGRLRIKCYVRASRHCGAGLSPVGCSIGRIDYATGPDEFIFAGAGLVITFENRQSGDRLREFCQRTKESS